MEPESSSPHSQAPATYPYPEPAQSTPHTHIPLLQSGQHGITTLHFVISHKVADFIYIGAEGGQHAEPYGR
jgi:hypothetical protein